MAQGKTRYPVPPLRSGDQTAEEPRDKALLLRREILERYSNTDDIPSPGAVHTVPGPTLPWDPRITAGEAQQLTLNKSTTPGADGLSVRLLQAAWTHIGEAVRALIEAGAPLDHVNNLGWTALIEAVILGNGGPRHTATVEALVKAGASTDIADRQGATPLQHARARGYVGMAALIEATRQK